MTNPTSLLLLPGLMNDGRVWDPIRKSMPDERHLVTASTHLTDSIAATAASAIASMPPGKFGVAGFSLGGYVAIEVCRQAPERVAGIALLDTGARADSEEAAQNRKRMVAALGSGSASFAQIAGGFAPRLVHEAHANDSQLIDLLGDMARSVGSDGFVRQQTAAMNRLDGREVLKSLRCPALVLCGREDQITPPALSEEMAGLLAGQVDFVVIDRCGHMSTLEQPEAVSAAFVRWTTVVDAEATSGL